MSVATSDVIAPLVVNGWSIYAHPLFLDQLEGLVHRVEARKARDSKSWQQKNCTKRLAAIYKIVTEAIPVDPGAPQFRQRDALGESRNHWFRVKFFQQYRLFFRYDSNTKLIIVTWVNDKETLRAYGGKTDVCATFKGMLDAGNPPDDFSALMKESVAASERFEKTMKAAS